MANLWTLLGREKAELSPKLRNYLVGYLVVLAVFLMASLLVDSLFFIKDDIAGWPRWTFAPLLYLHHYGYKLGYWGLILIFGTTVGILMVFPVHRGGNAAHIHQIVLAMLCLLVATYFMWASSNIARLWSFPSVVPIYHPASFLPSLHDWLDQQHPSPPGHFKWHGEIFRLRALLHVAICLPLLAAMIPAYRLTYSLRPPDPRFCQGCGYDLKGTKDAGRHECPECGCVICAEPPVVRDARHS